MLKAPPEPVIVLWLAIPLPLLAAMFCKSTSLGDYCMLTTPAVLRALLPLRELPPFLDWDRLSLLPGSSPLAKLPVLSASIFVIFKFFSFSEASKIGVLFCDTLTWDEL